MVDAGHVGVVRTLRAVTEPALADGFHFKKPFMDRAEHMDIRIAKSQVNAASSSRDLQNVDTQVIYPIYTQWGDGTKDISMIGANPSNFYQR